MTKIYYLSLIYFQGLNVAIVGPALLDLEIITGSNTENISFIFTARSVGGLLGAILFSILVNKINNRLMLCIALFCMMIMGIYLPWCRTLPMMAVVIGIGSFAGYFFDAGKE